MGSGYGCRCGCGDVGGVRFRAGKGELVMQAALLFQSVSVFSLGKGGVGGRGAE